MSPEFPDLISFDLNAASDEGRWLVLKHPGTGQPLKNEDGTLWRLLVRGKDGKHYRRKAHALLTREAELESDPGYQRPEGWEPDDRTAELLACCILNWEGLRLDKRDFPYSPENAFTLLRRFYWILREVDIFTGTRSNYLGN